jgi:hypothetical protein
MTQQLLASSLVSPKRLTLLLVQWLWMLHRRSPVENRGSTKIVNILEIGTIR